MKVNYFLSFYNMFFLFFIFRQLERLFFCTTHSGAESLRPQRRLPLSGVDIFIIL